MFFRNDFCKILCRYIENVSEYYVQRSRAVSAKIINFPLNRQLNKITNGTATVSAGKSPFEEYSSTIHSNNKHKSFEDILADEELANEKFPPLYFLLVE
jgi:hypothetical protein